MNRKRVNLITLKKICFFLVALTLISVKALLAQKQPGFWNHQTKLQPWRLPLPDDLNKIERIDLDKDGDPDIIKYTIMDSIPVMWVDDDDDMKWTDIEGDMDNDCLFIDRNNDGVFGGQWDISIDWDDENGDGKADMQFVVGNDNPANRNGFDWKSDLMLIIDDEKDNVFNYIDWNRLNMRPWEHSGHSNFFTDYHGNTMFTKMSVSSYRISDFRFSWENPFIFWDYDNDGMSEMAIRMLDIPHFRPKDNLDSMFRKVEDKIDVLYSKKISYVAVAYDLDNDNGQGNEFDFDMSLCFEGDGFEYSDQVNIFKSLRGLPDADKLIYDPGWRKLTELIFPNRQTALDLTFKRGSWNKCRFVFDEDDDCNRWERVEFYEPKNLFIIGAGKGGLDNNPQADAIGDRGEFDMDFSGKGDLYIGGFDNRIHLYGAEWGAWRIDQTAFSFQGFGGLYDLWSPSRIQRDPGKFGTVKYTDTDNNGFFDLIQYDLDGDNTFEESVSLKELNIDDRRQVIQTSAMSYPDFQKLFKEITEKNWERALQVIRLAKKYGLGTDWYAFWKSPRTLWEKYDYSYWLNFYIYNDLRQMSKLRHDKKSINKIDHAYYSGNWQELL
jgi:hypothetical protein